VITGQASFVTKHQVIVRLSSTNEQVMINADRIFINTGTDPFIPDIPGITSSEKVFTSASLMDQRGLHRKLIVIGGRFVGLEFANMYAKFGSEVILIEQNTQGINPEVVLFFCRFRFPS
jgi:pyruvate/2-oxoglutarate dehydrogenase complex dihydrolipoamide dehydrogenase (E3) component